jgi:hypothetical protein
LRSKSTDVRQVRSGSISGLAAVTRSLASSALLTKSSKFSWPTSRSSAPRNRQRPSGRHSSEARGLKKVSVRSASASPVTVSAERSTARPRSSWTASDSRRPAVAEHLAAELAHLDVGSRQRDRNAPAAARQPVQRDLALQSVQRRLAARFDPPFAAS